MSILLEAFGGYFPNIRCVTGQIVGTLLECFYEINSIRKAHVSQSFLQLLRKGNEGHRVEHYIDDLSYNFSSRINSGSKRKHEIDNIEQSEQEERASLQIPSSNSVKPREPWNYFYLWRNKSASTLWRALVSVSASAHMAAQAEPNFCKYRIHFRTLTFHSLQYQRLLDSTLFDRLLLIFFRPTFRFDCWYKNDGFPSVVFLVLACQTPFWHYRNCVLCNGKRFGWNDGKVKCRRGSKNLGPNSCKQWIKMWFLKMK